MTDKNTPGPWKAVKGVEGEPDRWAVVTTADGPDREWFVATVENGRPGDTLHTEAANAALIAAAPETAAERDRLLAFKGYVHFRLDAAGIDPRPNGPHSAEGCRVGDRLDELIGQRDALLAAVVEAESFISGFDDELQEGIGELLASLQSAIAKAKGGGS